MSITEVFDRVLSVEPDRAALLAPSGTRTYAQLDHDADAAAAVLRDLGVRPGDRVAVSLPNDVDIVVAFHGVMRLGAVWVGVNRNLAPPERAALLDAAGPTFVLDDDTIGDWRTNVQSTQAERLPVPDPHAPSGIAYTSGTTGAPKGVVHSQHNLLLPARSLVASRRYDERLRKGDCLALTILNMQVLTTLVTATAGGCCVITDRRDAAALAAWVERERVTVWNGVPAILHGMVHDDAIAPSALRSLDEAWTGGSACPEQLFRDFQAKFGMPLRATYGLTEAPTVVAMDPVDEPHVPDTSGRVLPHLSVRIDDGEVVVGAASDGTFAGAYTPMLGTWDGGTVVPFEGSELRTGDVGVVEDGRLRIVDRKKLLIIRGGANVHPAEVERVLADVPGVRGCAVLGLPDERLGQRVVAAVEVEDGFPGVGAALDRCREHLARYKVPEQLVVVDELPRNAMGKVQRDLLLDRF